MDFYTVDTKTEKIPTVALFTPVRPSVGTVFIYCIFTLRVCYIIPIEKKTPNKSKSKEWA